MHLYLDSAEIEAIRPLLSSPVVHGVTTNPTLQQRAGVDYAGMPEFVREALSSGASAVQVQVRYRDTRQMVADGHAFSRWADPEEGEVIVKIPATPEGLAATAELTSEGIPCTLTAVFAPEQAIWAQLAGARYAAPYLGRLNDGGENGLEVIARMQELLSQYRESVTDDRKGADSQMASGCRLLVASVRSREDALALLRLGVGALTVRPELAIELLEHVATRAAEATFLEHAGELK